MAHLLLVDDQPLIRAGLRGILSADPTFQVSEVSNGWDAISAVDAGGIDLVLMDMRMPGIGGAETTRRIREIPGRSPRILVLTTFDGDETVLDAVENGADGFIGKSIEPDELLTRIRSVLQGNTELSPAAARALLQRVASPASAPLRIDPQQAELIELLTPRERAIVVAVSGGLRNDQIAAVEHISQHTVKTHINRAMAKIGVSDRGQLVAFAFRSGLVRQ